MASGERYLFNKHLVYSWPPRCKMCGKKSTSVHRLNPHIESHIGGMEHPCPTCEKTFKSRPSLYMHKSRNHTKSVNSLNPPKESQVEYACPSCDKTFKSRPSLYMHKSRNHTMRNKLAKAEHSPIDMNVPLRS